MMICNVMEDWMRHDDLMICNVMEAWKGVPQLVLKQRLPSVKSYTVKKVSYFPVPSQGEFGNGNPGWGREISNLFLQCTVNSSSKYISSVLRQPSSLS
jgi:hypothetical protein